MVKDNLRGHQEVLSSKSERISKERTSKEMTPREMTPREITPREITPREMTPREMTKAKYVFRAFAIWFQPLYFLMLWMYYDQLQTEENTLARFLDICLDTQSQCRS